MRDLVQDLARYTSLSILKNTTQKIIDIRSVIETLQRNHQKRLNECNATVIYHNAPAIRGYPDQIYLLFDCLLDNSIKFCRKGEPLTIEISKEAICEEELKTLQINPAHRAFIKIRFSDNGIGFNPEFSDKMFGIFQRLHAQANEYEGKGVGLALVKRIISNHNGFILAKGVPGKGAEFSMYFPKDE
jgi:signal transduction histidine kinase